MSKLKVFKKSFNSYSGKHEFNNDRDQARLLHGTGYMELVDYEDYKELQAKVADYEEFLSEISTSMLSDINNCGIQEDFEDKARLLLEKHKAQE